MKRILAASIAFVFSAQFALAAQPAIPPSAPFSGYGTAQRVNSATLRSTLTKVGLMTTAAPAQIRAVIWGDSTAGFHAGPLVTALANMFPMPNSGTAYAGIIGCMGATAVTGQVQPCVTTTTSGSVTTTAGGGDFTQTPTGGYFVIGVGGCVTFAVNSGYFLSNKQSIFYIKQNGAGTLTLNTNLNGAGWVAGPSANAQNATPVGAVLTTTEGSPGLYQHQACVSGAGPVTIWMGGFENTSANGVIGIVSGQPGASLSQMNTPPTAITAPWFAYFAPDLITFEMKMNGGGWSSADLSTWYSNWSAANGIADFVMVGSYPVSTASGDAQNITQNNMLKQFALTHSATYYDGYSTSINYTTEKALNWISDASSPHQSTLGQLASTLDFLNFVGIGNWQTGAMIQNVNNVSTQSQTITAYSPNSGSSDWAYLYFGNGNSTNKASIGASFWNGGVFFGCIRDLTGHGFHWSSNAGTLRMYLDCANNKLAIGNNTSPAEAIDTSAAGGIRTKTTTVGTLPTCNAGEEGAIYEVSDANAPAWNTALAGGGTAHVGARCNGTSWVAF